MTVHPPVLRSIADGHHNMVRNVADIVHAPPSRRFEASYRQNGGASGLGAAGRCMLLVLCLLAGCAVPQHPPPSGGANARGGRATPISQGEAHAIAAKHAGGLGGGKFEVEPATLISGRYWHVVVCWLPPRPGGSFMVDVSVRDGTIVKTYPGM